MKFLMGLFAALLMIGSAQAGGFRTGIKSPFVAQDVDDAKGYFWNLHVGDKMTMESTMVTPAGDVKGPTVDCEVTKLDNKVCTIKYSHEGHGSETIMASKDGYFCYGLMADGKFDAKMRLFKYGAKVGDTWDGWAFEDENHPVVTVKYVGLEELKLGGNTYKDVIHVQAVVTEGPTLDYYFAPKMGMVKFTFSTDGELRRRIEMATFTEAK